MCTQKPPNNWSEQLYNYYCEAVKEYLSARILPRIKEKHDESMLRELVRRWENHKLLVRFLSHVFKYLDRFYVKRLSLHELAEVGSQAFHDIVFNAMKRDVRAAILELIRREREGEMVDRKLIKQVVEIFVDMGGQRNSLEVYVQDFEDMLLSTTGARARMQPAPANCPSARCWLHAVGCMQPAPANCPSARCWLHAVGCMQPAPANCPSARCWLRAFGCRQLAACSRTRRRGPLPGAASLSRR
jgi:hypothetical protein